MQLVTHGTVPNAVVPVGGKFRKHMAMQSENLGTALHCTVSIRHTRLLGCDSGHSIPASTLFAANRRNLKFIFSYDTVALLLSCLLNQSPRGAELPQAKPTLATSPLLGGRGPRGSGEGAEIERRGHS